MLESQLNDVLSTYAANIRTRVKADVVNAIRLGEADAIAHLSESTLIVSADVHETPELIEMDLLSFDDLEIT